jgi:hypothetical protein
VLTDTQTRQSTSLELHDIHPHQSAAPRISGDGKHVFWSVSGQLFHARIENLEIQAPAAITEIESCSYNFSVSYDGSRVIFRVMGPEINGRNPGWYAVRTANYDGQNWTVSDFLSPLVPGRDASHLGMTTNGQFLYWSYEGTLMVASRSPQGTYKEEALPRSNAEQFASGMSEDGTTFLSVGYQPAAGGGRKSHTYVSYRGPRGFSEPRPILPEPAPSIANAWLSADGRTVIEHYLEYQQDSTLTAIGLRRAQVNPATLQWQVTGELARYPGTTQITEAYLSAAGSMAFTTYDHLVQPSKSEIMFLPGIGPSVMVQNLSRR